MITTNGSQCLTYHTLDPYLGKCLHIYLFSSVRIYLQITLHFFCLADIKQEMLETIVPKSEYDSIMVVLGEHRGQVSSHLFFCMICGSGSWFVQQLQHFLFFSGWPYSSAGQEQVQSNSSTWPIWGQSVYIWLRLYLSVCRRSSSLIYTWPTWFI